MFDDLTGHETEAGKVCGACDGVATRADEQAPAGERRAAETATDVSATRRQDGPVPAASKRAQSTTSFHEDPTARPSQAPLKALQTVIASLEAEREAFGRQLEAAQALHNASDASKGRRKRKRRVAEIEKLLALVESKADQVYALHDVLAANAL